VQQLPPTTRIAMSAAGLFLLVGVALGAVFAIDPVMGARLRLSHAEVNLFGFVALVIVGAGNYLVPRFAGRVPRWPRLAVVEIGGLAGGVTAGAVAFGLRSYGYHVDGMIAASQSAIAVGIGAFAVWVGATFASKPGSAMQLRPAARKPLCPGVARGALMSRQARMEQGGGPVSPAPH
jgi:hypothetical protein